MSNDQSAIVRPTVVHFGESTAKADDLEAVVTPSDISQKNVGGFQSWQLENMAYLGVEVMKKNVNVMIGIDNNDLTLTLSPMAQKLIPYAVMYEGENLNVTLRTIRLTVVSSALLRTFLEAEYGPEIAQAGIYTQVIPQRRSKYQKFQRTLGVSGGFAAIITHFQRSLHYISRISRR